jgi:hypothetical protein
LELGLSISGKAGATLLGLSKSNFLNVGIGVHSIGALERNEKVFDRLICNLLLVDADLQTLRGLEPCGGWIDRQLLVFGPL